MSGMRRSRSTERELQKFKTFWERIRALFPETDLEVIEELADELARRIPKPREARTHTINIMEKTLTGTLDLIKSDAGGKLEELVIISESPDFTVMIETDGAVRIEGPYKKFEEISPYSEVIDAYVNDAGKYVLRFRNIAWLRSFRAFINSPKPMKLTRVWGQWEERL